VTVSTAGASIDVDADGYTLSIDSEAGQSIGVNALITFSSVVRGEHVARLAGLSANCAARGGNARTVNALNSSSGSPVSISFFVLCGGEGSGAGGWDY
jgi:hypothetical protein